MSRQRRQGRLRRTLWCFLLLFGWGVASASAQQAEQTVGQWDRFEAAVTNPKAYADPYRDVELRVTYTKPSGETAEFWGFYDGGETWKIRFMPDQLGLWRYASRYSDGSPGRSGTFRVVPSDLPGMISVDETNPLWFGFKGGQQVLIRSFHVGDRFFAENWDDPTDSSDGERRTLFVDWTRRQGYNMLSIGSHYLNREAEGRGAGWETPDLWPLNAAEYRKLERILDELARHRIMVFPFGGFFGRDSDFPRDHEDQERYVRYTLARVGPYWNVMFNVGGPEPLLGHNPYLTKDEVDRLGRTIERLDVFGHPLTVHNPGGGDEFRDRAWLDYGTLQGPKTADLEELSAELLENHHARKPLYAQETLWSGNIYHMRDLGDRDYTDDELRKNAYVINLSATALNFADTDGDSSSGFSGTLELSDAAQRRHDIVKRVWDFFETVLFHRMTPCQELVSAGYCLGEEGRQYLVYLPEGGSVEVRLPTGPYAVEWIDGRDPSRRRPGPTLRTGSRLTAPAEGDDWLAYLSRLD